VRGRPSWQRWYRTLPEFGVPREAETDCSVDGVRNRRSGSALPLFCRKSVFSIGPNCDTCSLINNLLSLANKKSNKKHCYQINVGERSSFPFEKIWISVLLILEKEERGEQ
jgi:hypothetical protein